MRISDSSLVNRPWRLIVIMILLAFMVVGMLMLFDRDVETAYYPYGDRRVYVFGTPGYIEHVSRMTLQVEDAYSALARQSPDIANKFKYHLIVIDDEYLFTWEEKEGANTTGAFVDGNSGSVRVEPLDPGKVISFATFPSYLIPEGRLGLYAGRGEPDSFD